MSGVALHAAGFHLPTGLVLGEGGECYVAESGLALGGRPAGGNIWRVNNDGARQLILSGLRPPVNGITLCGHQLYIAEGGQPGRISVLDLDSGTHKTILDDLPGGGNYHTDMVAVAPDGWLYFGQGAMTNSGVVGDDAMLLGWLKRLPHPPDIPGRDLVLSGWNAATAGPHQSETGVVTGAFQEFGTPGRAGQRVHGKLPCTAAVMRCRPDGSDLELVAWGLRNPYGLGFDRQGRLLALDLGINDRGSRPVGQVPDCLFEVVPGRWYGWPDYAAGLPVTDPAYQPARGASPRFVLANHDELGQPAQPLFAFKPHEAPTKFAPIPGESTLAIALFGDKLPMTGPPGPRVGRSVIRLNLERRRTAVLRGLQAHRPIDLCFDAEGTLYVLDFGRYEMTSPADCDLGANSGAIYKVSQPVWGSEEYTRRVQKQGWERVHETVS